MSIIHITLSFLFFFTFNFRDVSAVPTRHVCCPEQRDALLQFKLDQFEIGNSSSSCFPTMKSWRNNSDCCHWDGIRCDAKTGEVIKLDLKFSCLHGRFHSNSTLFKLQNLRFLDLSFNDLYGQIASSIGKLSLLTSLDLSDNQFSGEIPSSIGNLSHLTSLDLSVNQLSGQIPSSIGKLSHLTSLDLSRNQFSGQIPSSIGKLSHLTLLYLSFNKFSGEIPSSIGKLLHLTSLSLSFNQFSGEIPSSINNFSHLEILDFSYNNFDGEIPSFLGSLNRLTSFDVEFNKLSGNLPITLLNLTNLRDLSLSNNRFTGRLPPNMSSLSNLEDFYADDNYFVGSLPSSLFTIPSLTFTIDLSNNGLSSTLEFGNISSPSKLQWLHLGSNNFRGPIPRTISKLVNLEWLDLSHWNTQGIKVDFSIFSHLKLLQILDLSHLNTTINLNAISSFSKSPLSLNLSGNHVLATNKSSISDPPLQLISSLYLSDCGITEFPEILRAQLPMVILIDVSNNKIKGQVPSWLWMLPNLFYVNLSNNTFNGFERPTKLGLSSTLQILLGSKNNFIGKIPSFICELAYLRTLDLSDNNLDGPIPLCLENLKTTLSVLNLCKNHLSGGLPENVFESLRSFDVGHNQLVGKLPRSLIHFSKLEVLNVESNRIKDTFPFWLNSLQNLTVLVLRSNAFHGPIHQASFVTLKIIDISHNHFSGILPSDYFANWSNMSSSTGTNKGTAEDPSNGNYIGDSYYHDSMVLINKGIEMEMVRILKIYTALDFSGNRLQGEIPKSIGLLKELLVLNLSNNAFTGHIPSSMANLTALESLDVSQNKLSGEIPQELGNLSFLAYMNFSNNQLSGLVPGGTQFRRQNCSSFEPNLGLIGPALVEVCRDIHTPSSKQNETPEAEEEEVFSWLAAAIGFVPGITLGLTIGYILVSYRPEWFTSPFSRNKRTSRRTRTR